MKIILFFSLVIMSSSQMFANDFDDEFNFLKNEALISDEVKVSNAGIQKEEITKEIIEDKKINDENIFIESTEVKPRRIRSR